MPREKYPESFIAFMDQLKRYPLILKNEDQERLVKAGVSTIESQPINITVEAPDTKQLRPWTLPKPLKQQILESDDPRLEIYRKLIQAWPGISDTKLKEILQGTPRDRIEKVLEIHNACGKLFMEFLQPNITYEEILLLDRIFRYYILLSQAKELGLLENLKNGFKYDVSVDGKKYQAELLAFVDNVPVSINFYPDQFNRPVLGVPYSDWPCFSKTKEKLKQKAEALAASLKELRFNKDELMNLETELEYIKELENSFFQLSIKLFISFPVKYTAPPPPPPPPGDVNNIKLPCSLCGKQHNIWFIARVK
jgi:hypothetical protein